jgi:hypothetical protein
MKWKIKITCLLLAGISILNTVFAKAIISTSGKDTTVFKNDSIKQMIRYGQYKKLPKGYEYEAVQALSHFPELAKVPVKFRIKKAVATLKTRPTFLSMFMPRGHRSYVITISNQTITILTPLLFSNLPQNARIGIIGHELSHVVDFSKKSTWQSFKTAIGHLSKKYLDSLEFNTDKICIEHGLGKELETWSSYIRNTMHTTYWRGAGFANKGDTHFERYMNPNTIEKYIKEEMAVSHSTIINAR